MTLLTHARRIALRIVLSGTLAGCQTATAILAPPQQSSTILQQLTGLDGDAAALFAALSAPAPGCATAGNGPQAQQVRLDLAALQAAAQLVPGDTRTATAVADLQSGYGHFLTAAVHQAPACLPRQSITDYRATFETAVVRLRQYEQLKPTGVTP